MISDQTQSELVYLLTDFANNVGGHAFSFTHRLSSLPQVSQTVEGCITDYKLISNYNLGWNAPIACQITWEKLMKTLQSTKARYCCRISLTSTVESTADIATHLMQSSLDSTVESTVSV